MQRVEKRWQSLSAVHGRDVNGERGGESDGQKGHRCPVYNSTLRVTGTSQGGKKQMS